MNRQKIRLICARAIIQAHAHKEGKPIDHFRDWTYFDTAKQYRADIVGLIVVLAIVAALVWM